MEDGLNEEDKEQFIEDNNNFDQDKNFNEQEIEDFFGVD